RIGHRRFRGEPGARAVWPLVRGGIVLTILPLPRGDRYPAARAVVVRTGGGERGATHAHPPVHLASLLVRFLRRGDAHRRTDHQAALVRVSERRPSTPARRRVLHRAFAVG